jgi:adhesin transport system membrane fusion protein
MAEPAKKQVPVPKKEAPPSVNQATEWAKVRSQWAREQLSKAEAHADRFFTTDEELPLRDHLLLVFIGLFFVVFLLWANFATLDQVTRGDGKVIPSTEIQIIQHQEGGIVREFLAKEGQEVKAGQVLMKLSDVGSSSDLGANQKRYLGLKAKAQRLQAQTEGKISPEFTDDVMRGVPESVTEELNAFRADSNSLQSQLSVLDEQVRQRQQEINELNQRAGDLRGVIGLSQQERNTVAPLVERGSAPKLELLQLDRAIKEKQTELNSSLSSIPRAKAAASEAQARINELKTSARAKAQADLSLTTAEMNAIKETLSALSDRQKRTDILSPVEGVIKDFKVNTVGGVIQPGQEVVEIVPKDDQLLVEARVRPADIAFLYPGQKAIVKITAYDYSIYGSLKGDLVDISADTITNEKGESFYRVRIRTDETQLKRHGEVLPIIPGMVASVDILTGKKTVMEYLMKPLFKTLDNSMKER